MSLRAMFPVRRSTAFEAFCVTLYNDQEWRNIYETNKHNKLKYGDKRFLPNRVDR